ncbi:uncharacterized protein TNCV_1494631 [Trichonephila clavipes]|nr:uncharacterized protein TNCV_1494631 [Trichonephila clavipes]
MSDLSDFEAGNIVGAPLAGTSVTKTPQIVGVSKVTVPKAMPGYTQRDKTSSTKQNIERKEKLSERDRKVLNRVLSKKKTTAAKMTTELNQHLDSPVSLIIKSVFFQFGLAIHQNDHQARRRFVEWAQNEIAVVPPNNAFKLCNFISKIMVDFHKRILFSDEEHFWLNGYVNKQNCRIWSEANPQEYVETPLHLEKLTVWCALWAGGIILQKR